MSVKPTRNTPETLRRPHRVPFAPMDLGLSGTRALITGGSRGLGKAIARRLGAENVTCVISGRDAEVLDAAAEELRAAGGTVETVEADMRDVTAIEDMVARAADLMGGLDILVNNAARSSGSEPENFFGVSDDLIIEDFTVKFLGYLRAARAAAPHMRAAGWGRILNVGGLAARQPGSISAGARNTAIVHLTASMAAELGRSGVNVNAVHPGLTETESFRDKISKWASDFGMDVGQLEGRMTQQISIGRFVTADEVAAVVTFLVSPLAVAVNGEVIAVGGGSTQAVYY